MTILTLTAARVCILSDIHNGRPGNTAAEAARVVAGLDTETLLVLNGDVGPDALFMATYGLDRLAWSDGDMALWRGIMDFLQRGGKVVWLAGNHDVPLLALGHDANPTQSEALMEMFPAEFGEAGALMRRIRVGQSLVVTVGARTVLVEHGLRYDWLLERGLGRLERALLRGRVRGVPPAGDFIANKMWHGRVIGTVSGLFARYSRLGRRLGVDAVVLGHLHCPGLRWRRPVPVWCGSCFTNGWAAYTVLDAQGVRMHNLRRLGV